ncbi:phage portal protein [Reyranella sp.]|jgi:lambda family phage portal protein|uniref:phage portal protein n=1 Tax=Reyranella sp. TaxID=1929291 RepID=UPI002603722E|nr:phage portal protein [Reyranella sp.]HQS18616.1 phage portal protein [Reyranella sp.]HQT14834.1 phage portal protein [Reyranella sp.]
MKPARKRSLRGRVALGLTGLAKSVQRGAMALGGFAAGKGGYDAADRKSRRTRGWLPGEGSPASDILPGLEILRGRSRDLERNNPLALGAIQTKANGVVGTGLKLRADIDIDVLGIEPKARAALQYQIEREWDLFEKEADFTGQMHFSDMQRLIYRSARVSGDIAIARRWRKRPGDTYGTRIVLIEADRISNPKRVMDSAELQGGVKIASDGEILGYYVTDRHPGDLMTLGLEWSYVARRGKSGILQMLLPAQVYRPGQVRGVPLFAPIEEALKQLGDYSAAEIKAAINDAYLFAFEQSAAEDDGGPSIAAPDGQPADDAGELTLSDLAITSLAPGRTIEVKKPSRPNTAFDDFVGAFCKQIGVALELPYEVLLGKFDSSFSASRGALEVAWKGFQVDQAWLIRSVLDPIREWQFTEMVASGRFDAPGFFDDPIKRAAWLGRIWIGPTRIQINPQVEANSDKIDIDMGTKTREQVMTERTGGDFDTKSKQVLLERQVLGSTTPEAAVPASSPESSTSKDDDGKDDADGNKQPD